MQTETPHKNHRQRMRERFKQNGLPAFKTHEILEMLLFAVYSRVNTNEIAHRLLQRFGGIADVLSADEKELTEVSGVGEKASWWLRFLRDLYSGITSERFSRIPLDSEGIIGAYSIVRMGLSPAGSASVTFLSGDCKINSEKWICIGKSQKGDIVDVDLMEKQRSKGAKSIILMHNHRGMPGTPSPDDVAITESVKAEAKAMGYDKVLHVIVFDAGYTFI